MGKTLKSTKDEGELIKLSCFKSGKEEAIGISDEIEQNLKINFLIIMLQF